MKVIGITGGVGAGKSTILNEMKRMSNCSIIIADELAKNLQEPGNVCYEKIVNYLGEDILENGPGSRIDKSRMAEKIFSDKDKLQGVNSIIHPAVKEYILNEIKLQKEKNEIDILFIEAALLIEEGYDVICDQMWYIYADKEVRIERLIKNRGYSRQKAISIIDKQCSDEVFKQHCKVVIDNSKGIDDALKCIESALRG